MGAVISELGSHVPMVESDCALELIAADIRQKEKASLEEFAKCFEEHKPCLLRMVRARLSARLLSRDGEEGVLQNMYVRSQRAWLKQQPDAASVYVWLYGKTWSEVIDQLRRGRADMRNEEREVDWPDGSVAVLSQCLGLSTDLGLKDAVALIRQVLKPIEFEIVWMHIVDKLTFPDIAAILTEQTGKITQGDAVRKRYVRAVEKARTRTPDPFAPSSDGRARR